jgi:TonB family protein
MQQLCFKLSLTMPGKFCFLLICFFFVHLAARAESIKDALNHKYKKQVLALRSPFTQGTQKFDSQGQPMEAPPKGPWLLYGGIHIDKLNLSADTLSLEGPRIGFSGEKNGKPSAISLSKTVHIEIHLDQPLKSADEGEAILNRVFFLDGDSKEHANPEFRRADAIASTEPIYKIKQDEVLPPHATYTPVPRFSEAARHAKFQGTVILQIVVDKTGHVAKIRLERALGYDLDDNAMEGVKVWRFDPATQNGQPVAVVMNIEVSFNLY